MFLIDKTTFNSSTPASIVTYAIIFIENSIGFMVHSYMNIVKTLHDSDKIYNYEFET